MIFKEKEIISSYKKNGYTVVKNLIPYELIEDVLKIYTRLISQKPLIYTQSTHKWEEIQLDNEGLIIQSILNPSTLKTLHPLNDCLEGIIYHKNIEKALSIIFTEKAFKIGCWQDMFFDKSTATIPHIDSWYLDTLPKGDLLGAWIALEDIRSENGSFYVYPGSHLNDWSALEGFSHDQFIENINDFCKKNEPLKKELHINNGDVVFWNSKLVHGSTKQKTKGYSRKSLTAHYFPYPSSLIDSKRTYNIRSVNRRLKKNNNTRIERFNSNILTTNKYRHIFGKIGNKLNKLGIKVGPNWDMRNRK